MHLLVILLSCTSILPIYTHYYYTVEPRLSGPRLSERSIIRTRHNAVYTFK